MAPTHPTRSRTSAGGVASRLRIAALLTGVLAGAVGCLTEPSAFNQKFAELSCKQAQECTPEQFELTCQAACSEDEQCPSERCNRLTGVCRDDDGPLPTELLGDACDDTEDCGGGPICTVVYDDLQDCVDNVQNFYEMNFADHCEYDPPLARECIRAVKKRGCGDSRPEVCDDVYRDCVF